MLLVGAALLAASVFLFSLLFGLFGPTGAFATGSILLAITVIWDVTVERPNRQDRLSEAYAASARSGKGIPAGTPVDTTYWTDALAEPFRALGRKAPPPRWQDSWSSASHSVSMDSSGASPPTIGMTASTSS